MDKEGVENALRNLSYEKLDYTISRKRHLAEDHPVECNKPAAERQASRVCLFCRLQVGQSSANKQKTTLDVERVKGS